MLCGRRATFEYVLQRYVRGLPHVRMVYKATVTGFSIAARGGKCGCRSIEVKRDGASESIAGDMFIDCMGRRSPMFGLVARARTRSRERLQEAKTSFSRHYRLREGARRAREQSGDIDFLRYAIVYGEDGHFAIGFSVAEDDDELIRMIRRAEGFDGICDVIPQLRDWVTKADALTPVMGMGNIRNRWIEWADGKRPLVLGLLHAGDSARETNPFYGRGCSAAFVDAHLVAEALLASRDPAQRARSFAARVRAELRPYYEIAVRADLMFQARSLSARGFPISIAHRLIGHAYFTLAVPAAFEDAGVARVLLGVQHMRPPRGVLTALRLLGRMLYLALRRVLRRSKPASPLSLPLRSQILAQRRE